MPTNFGVARPTEAVECGVKVRWVKCKSLIVLGPCFLQIKRGKGYPAWEQG